MTQVGMAKSNSKRIVKPPLDRFGGIRVVQRRIQKSKIIEHNKENVAQELIDIAKANIDDIMSWDEDGKVTIKDPKAISPQAIKAIKKIKVTPTKMGPQLEVELHDKVGVLRVLAKATGLLDPQEELDKPSVVGIVMKGPEEPVIVNAEEVNEESHNTPGEGDNPGVDVKKSN